LEGGFHEQAIVILIGCSNSNHNSMSTRGVKSNTQPGSIIHIDTDPHPQPHSTGMG
jgi:hypothetical protein